MKWVEYKLENGEVIKAPYNRLDVAPISKNCLEELINDVNASMRQAKILEHIKTNYAYEMREQYEKGRADAINAIKNDLHNRLTEEMNKPYQDQGLCQGLYFGIQRCDWYLDDAKEHNDGM